MKKIHSIIILAMSSVKRLIAVLDLPADIDDFITKVNGIYNSMNTSALFASLAAKLATLLTNIGKLQTAHNGTKTVPPTHTIAERDTELGKVKGNMRTLVGNVQELADATPASAEVIITSAGMKVKKQGSINKQDFVVSDGELSGSALLVAKGIPSGKGFHCWAMSNDGLVWEFIYPTMAATTIVDGLTIGKTKIFRHCEIRKDGPTDWMVAEPHIVR